MYTHRHIDGNEVKRKQVVNEEHLKLIKLNDTKEVISNE